MLQINMFSKTFSRAFATSNIQSLPISNVTIIGAGIMGSGIAQVAAQAGYKVILVDKDEKILKRADEAITKSLTRIAKKQGGEDAAILKFVSETTRNITSSTNALNSLSNADLVVEAVIENREEKRKLLAELDKVAPESTIFTSNTSSFLIRSLAEGTSRRDKFAGLHFFNPVPVMKLLEIVSTPDVSPTIIKELEEFGKKIGKVCVKCNDTPGFIVNRLLIPHLMDAVRMAERGDAAMEDIDTAMKLGCGYPMGPFQLIDFAGVDTLKYVTDGWIKDYPEGDFSKSSKLLDKVVAEGRHGVKAGKGFYDYSK